ncbi:MAG: dipeptidase [Rhodoferax sp.]
MAPCSKAFWAALGLLLALALGGVALQVSAVVDARMNSVVQTAPGAAAPAARAQHAQLFVADLHNDALLWNRDLLQHYGRGHTDLPRLLQGQMALQVFATVTKTPKGLNYERNGADSDNITLLAQVQRWPRATWGSLLERALYQADKLHRAARASQGRLVVVKTRTDLQRFVRDWQTNPQRVAGVLATEGLHPLQGQLDNVDRLYDAGFRIAGLTHFFDNEVGGSAHGLQKGGLTPFGRAVVQRLEHKGVLVDLAHASPAVIEDVLAMATRPVLVSHTGVAATCPGPRNLSDDQLRRIAATGGLVGIGMWDGAVCAPDLPHVVRAIRHAVDVAGLEHVALGSDYDGATRMPWDVSHLALLTEALMQAGFSPDELQALMGGNVQRLLLQTLPEF